MHADKPYVARNGLFVRIQLDAQNCQLLNLGCPLPLIRNYLREKFIKELEDPLKQLELSTPTGVLLGVTDEATYEKRVSLIDRNAVVLPVIVQKDESGQIIGVKLLVEDHETLYPGLLELITKQANEKDDGKLRNIHKPTARQNSRRGKK